MAIQKYAFLAALLCVLVALPSCQSARSKQPNQFDVWAANDITRLADIWTKTDRLTETSNPTSKDIGKLHALLQQERSLYAKYHQTAPERYLPQAFAKKEADDQNWRVARSGKVCVGMSRDQARRAWGRPRSTNVTTSANGTSEQWCYDNDYLYFDDGTLTSIQTSR